MTLTQKNSLCYRLTAELLCKTQQLAEGHQRQSSTTAATPEATLSRQTGQILRRNRLHLCETQVPKEMTASPRSSRGEEHHPLSSQIANNADVIPTNTEPHGSGLGLPSTTKDDDFPGNNSGTNDNAPSSHTSRYGRAIVRPKRFSD
ncbi:hypothetical protein PoB_004081800 [Plakobranchus ocellatus]|uniref:Uncharacterized protein n=1 Tax=Plakobranchus ocellatus TaxID=259542 RepID=A0AAV4B5E6_9GAST|nr:hypothetical protein PoB_004081800 [Plakobranchus ocellatus]